jgi:uncharacterized protein (DUF433 family)
MTWHPSPAYVARMQARNAAILELWQLGVDRREIAESFGLTPARISQIVRSFGRSA